MVDMKSTAERIEESNLDHADRREDANGTLRHRLNEWYLKRRIKGSHQTELTLLELGPGKEPVWRSPPLGVLCHGIDLDPEAVRHCEGLGYRMKQGLVLDCLREYPESWFRTVVSRHCLEHTQDAEEVVKELYRVTLKNGWSLHEIPIPPYFEPTHIQELYRHEWARLFQEAGFTVYECEPVGLFGMKHYHLKARKGNHISQGIGGHWSRL